IQIDFRRSRLNRTAPTAPHVSKTVNGFDVERSIAEFERAFVSCSARGKVAARKQPARPGDHELLNLFTSRARSRHSFVAGRRNGQFPPSRHNLGSRIAQPSLIHYTPDVLSEVWGNIFARGERRQRRVGSAQRGAMLVLPGDEQRLAILLQPERSAAFARDCTEAVGGINVLDTRNGRKLKAGLAGAPKKFERPGPDHRMVGDDLRRCEITL